MPYSASSAQSLRTRRISISSNNYEKKSSNLDVEVSPLSGGLFFVLSKVIYIFVEHKYL